MNPILKIDASRIPQSLQGKWILLWDGDCGFCRRSVQWLLSQDKSKKIIAEPYQGQLSWLPEAIQVKSDEQVHLLDGEGQFWGGAEAARRALQLVGYNNLFIFLGLPLVRLFSDGGYRLVASHRRFFSKFFFRNRT